ncbi:MAG: type VI secretion system membrane subunit TssM [Polyangiaceae bacterium]
MWLWIFAILLLALIWVGGWLLRSLGVPIPLSAQIGLTAGVVSMVAGILLYRRWRAGAAARALEREIMKQTEQQAAMSAPDRRAEIIELKAQVERGIQALKQSKLGDRGQNALYTLPWFMIVGPPGAGKTTAIRHSGLNFPLLDATGGAVKGVGGTRNCDWWFTNEAILLDTAGRYATQDDDQPEWYAFLDLLRRFRNKRPINGVILAVSASDILEQTEEQTTQMARTLRARIDELQNRLDMVVPVYVMFTKVDLVAGFVEFFNDLKKSDRDRVFGSTFPMDLAVQRKPEELFEEEFALLISQIHARAIKRVAREKKEMRDRVVQFPLEFQALRTTLGDFLQALFEDNTQDDKPIFRGFYFSSGTQEGNPVDRVLGGLARAFGLAPRMDSEAQLEPKSYFVTDLFRRVVFPDQNIAARTRREMRRQWLSRIAMGATALFLAMMLLVPSSCSFSRNRKLVGTVEGTASSAAKVNWASKDSVGDKASNLTTIRALLKQLDYWRATEPPTGMRFGMYVGDELYEPLRGVYVNAIERGLKEPTQKDLEAKLSAFGAVSTTSGKEYNERYDLLKLYLMLTWPEKLDPEWAARPLANAWAKALRSPDPVGDAEHLLPHTRYYLDLMKRGEVKPWDRNDPTVTRARSALLRAPRLDRMYEALVREANADIKSIKHSDIFYGSVSPFITYKQDLQVQGAYTRDGWARVRELLGSQKSELSAERWVLGEEEAQQEADVEKQIIKLKNLYFERYKIAWRDFILDVEVHEPENAETSLGELTALSEPEWPYKRLIDTLHENVTLDISEGELAGLAESAFQLAKRQLQRKLALSQTDEPKKDVRPMSPVEIAFKPLTDFAVPAKSDDPEADAKSTGLAEYQGTLSKLVGVLTDLRDADAAPDPTAVMSEFEGAFRGTSGLLMSQSGFTRPMLSPLLMRPITFAWAGVVNDAGGAATGLWETNVWSVWRDTLANRYPFKKTQRDASLADFTEFFKPNSGLLWAFYAENLKGTLKRNGDAFTPSRRFNSSVGYKGDFLSTCLTRGAEISSAVFGKGEEPKIKFEVNLHSVSEDVSEVSIEIDGVSHVYKNHPEEWLAAEWPNDKGETPGARVRVRGYRGLDEEINRPGDFGIYRLIDAAQSVESGTAGGNPQGVPTVVVTWYLRSRDAHIKLDFKPSKRDRGLSPALFLGYDCPRVIAQ